MVNLSVLEQLLNHINRFALCNTTDKILLAVSGGLDSMVMFHLLKDAGLTVGVVHCNFQLRGDESMADEELVREVCLRYNIPVYVKKFDTTDYAAAQKISIQMAARELRYSYFEEVLEAEGYDFIATAHHFNDTIESIFLNLVRGTGIEGLAGIASKKGKVIRPLNFATREMILEYALQQKIFWREDSSNFSDDYQRNILRHHVMPRLKEMNPGFEETFRYTHERLLGAISFAQTYINGFQSSAVTVNDPKTTVDIRKIQQSPSPSVLLWELTKDFGFNYDQCRQMVNDHQPGKLFFSPSHQLLVDRTHYIIERKQASRFLTRVIEKGQSKVGEIPFQLRMRVVAKADFQLLKDSSLAQLDSDKVQFPLVWRKWQAGDYFIPLGMRQEKKLSDFLIDLKVPFNAKADITVLESAGDIVWVVGYRINERYKITADTQRILVIEQKQHAD